MPTIRTGARKTREPLIPPLRNGERLTQPEFHRRYETHTDDAKFELIGGTVHATGRVTVIHGGYTCCVGSLYLHYEMSTPGVEAFPNVTAIVDRYSETQADLSLRIQPQFGGQSATTPDEYVKGAAELLTEVAVITTTAIDLHERKDDYERAGIIEYLGLCIRKAKLRWFDLQARREIEPDAKGVYRSKGFPGLWIDAPALFAQDDNRLLRVLKRGLASPEHAAFVKRLQTRRGKVR